ncbi:hypothetical protein BV898_02128 [Hypsibius exemplaris]|uniref:Uncharacterized protein n=1 Tax=Hypsibius exemplaris TaxID=2072580 RepID=A0A1W0XA85_HYPEX|nr:hypothetical protein BV898_02128 [Hypsibius exemplaris]
MKGDKMMRVARCILGSVNYQGKEVFPLPPYAFPKDFIKCAIEVEKRTVTAAAAAQPASSGLVERLTTGQCIIT